MYGISYMSADVNISSDLCKHPIETGEVVTDNAIINPIKATVRINMPTALYSRIYAEIEKHYINKDYNNFTDKIRDVPQYGDYWIAAQIRKFVN